MANGFIKICFSFALVLGVFGCSYGQSDASLPSLDRNERKPDEPKSIKEMLAKQRLEKEKRDHEEMLKRGDEALRLSRQLETAFERNNQLSNQDKEKLASLEKIVAKIRKELGGDDDVDEIEVEAKDKPSSLQEAFKFLQSGTVKLVDELKKTTRFSISAAAIQSSNAVLRLVRFLRLRK